MNHHTRSFGIATFSAALLCAASVPSAQATPNLPSDLPVTSGLSVFIDGEALELDGINVIRAIDRSGGGNDALEIMETPPPRKPLLNVGATPSGMDSLHFDGVGGYMEIASNPEDFDGRAKTTFVVFRADDFAAAGRILTSGYTTVDAANPDLEPNYRVDHLMVSGANSGTLTLSARNATDGNLFVRTPNGTVVEDSFYIGMGQVTEGGDLIVAVRNEANERFMNQIEGATATPEGHLMTRIGTFSGFRNDDTLNFFPGDIAAILVYNRELTETEVTDVELYLHAAYLGSGGTLNPPVTNGLVLHLNPSGAVVENGYVDGWTDQSNRGNHAVSLLADAPPRLAPTFAAEATPSRQAAMHFNGVNQYLEILGNPSAFDGRPKTTLVVFRPHVLDGVGTMINSAWSELGSSGPQYLVHRMRTGTNDSLQVQNRTETGGSVLVGTGAQTLNVGEFHLGVNWWRSDGSTFAVLRTADNTRTVADTSGANAVPQGHIWTRLGNRSGADSDDFRDHFHGDIAAVVIYNRALEPSELFQMEEYMYARYLQPMLYDGWIAGFDLPPALRAPDANPSGDGVTNLEKYLFGMNPLVASREGLPEFGFLTIDSPDDEILLAWDVSGTGTVRSVGSTTMAAQIEPSTLSLGPGLTEMALANALIATGWGEVDAGFEASLADGHWIEFTVDAAEGEVMALSTLEFNLRRASRGAQTVQWAYSLDGTTFHPIEPATAVTFSGGDGAFYDPVDLSDIEALQGVGSVTFRMVGWDASGDFDAGRTLGVGRLSGNNLILTGAIVPEATGDFPMLTVNKHPSAAGVTVAVEASADLVDWNVDDVVIVEETDSVLRARLAVPVDDQERSFLRARVTSGN